MSDYGRMVSAHGIAFKRRFAADRAALWDHLVEPDKRARWFCGGSTGKAAGEEIVLDFDHRQLSDSAPPDKYAAEQQATHRGRLHAYDPPERLAFSWLEPGGSQSSEVTIMLSETSEGECVLELDHTGLADREMLIGVLAGWHAHLDLLAEVLGGERRSDFWTRDLQLEAEYARRV